MVMLQCGVGSVKRGCVLEVGVGCAIRDGSLVLLEMEWVALLEVKMGCIIRGGSGWCYQRWGWLVLLTDGFWLGCNHAIFKRLFMQTPFLLAHGPHLLVEPTKGPVMSLALND